MDRLGGSSDCWTERPDWPAPTGEHVRTSRLSIAVAAALLAATAAPALAATTSVPDAGEASSRVTLLTVEAAGHTASVVQGALSTSSLTGSRLASVAVTPLVADGKAAVPAVSINQDSTDQPAVPAQQKSVAGVLQVSSPALQLSAARTATGAEAVLNGTADQLVSVLGLPVKGSVVLGDQSGVAGKDAKAGKALTVTGLALPDLGDLLQALGLKVSALPVDTLLSLVQKLDLTGSIQSVIDSTQSTIDSLQKQVDDATAKLTDAKTALASAQQTLDSATATLTQKQADLTAAQADLAAATKAITDLGLTPGGVGVPSALQSTYDTAQAAVTAAQTAVNDAQSAVDAAKQAVTTAQSLVDTLQATLDGLLAQLQTAAKPLVDAILGVLGTTPLVSLGKLDVHTAAQAGATHAADVTGTVSGLQVLSTDVVKTVTGSSALDLVGTATDTLTKVQGQVSSLLGTLSSVLSSVPSLPELKIPAPTVALLQKSTSLDPVDGLQAATATVTALKITWPGVQIPTAVALPDALNLVGAATTATGALVGRPLALSIGTMDELAKSRPGTQATSGGTTGTPAGGELPYTGLGTWVPITALVLVGVALVTRRVRQV